jgi:hypothetical protein
MSFSDDIRDAKCRFPQHVKAFEDLFRKHRISSTATAWEALSSGSFREDMVELAEQLMKAEGGKLTFSVAFAIIGAALGGVGVAARYAAYLIKARRKTLHLKAAYIDVDLLSFETFPLHSDGGPYIEQVRATAAAGWRDSCEMAGGITVQRYAASGGITLQQVAA